jgi:hypothetical protein
MPIINWEELERNGCELLLLQFQLRNCVEELRKTISEWSVISRRYSNQESAEYGTLITAMIVHKEAVVPTV